MSDLEGLFHAEQTFAFSFFSLSRARRGTLSALARGLRTRSCLFLRCGGVMERAAERRDAEKRSMFPQQMGIIHAARVSAALRAPEYTACVDVKDDT